MHNLSDDLLKKANSTVLTVAGIGIDIGFQLSGLYPS
jgi:hypothetical protein